MSAADGRRAARALAQWCERFELSEPEFQVLWCLRDASGERVRSDDVGQTAGIFPAQVSATVERLRARGWISQHAALVIAAAICGICPRRAASVIVEMLRVGA